MYTQQDIQNEILNESGHQSWHKVTVRDFGNKNIEVSVMPYETWSEPSEEELTARTERGMGDRKRSAESAAKRAKRRVRHKCKLLQAKYMLTLTTREIITDIDVMQKYFQEFVRRIRLVGSFEYVATHELQKRGALHLHIAVANRQDYKLLWSIWHRVVGVGQGRVHVTSGNKKASVNRIAAYISKYISKSFLEGNLNKRKYWASKGIGEPVKTIHLLRKNWEFIEVLRFIVEICNDLDIPFDVTYNWCQAKKGLFWIAVSE
ncbi:MAG: hypothetical protein V4570_00210 [Pseudomonadota bacterium]